MCSLLNKELRNWECVISLKSLPRCHHRRCPPAQPDAQQPQQLAPFILQQFMMTKPSKSSGLTGMSRATGATSHTCIQWTHGRGGEPNGTMDQLIPTNWHPTQKLLYNIPSSVLKGDPLPEQQS